MILKWRNRPPSVLKYPNKVLKSIALPVDFENTTYEERSDIIRKMGAALSGQKYGDKLGISAPQIGISLRVIVIQGVVMFNPEWNPTKAPGNLVTEGCYSLVNRKFKVSRAPYGWAKWTNIEGIPMDRKLKDLSAIVFQHEFDHLDGKCCIDMGEEVEPSPASKE